MTSALNYLSSLVNVSFERVTSGKADINFGTNDQDATSGGYATGANSSLGTVNLLLNNDPQFGKVNVRPAPGDYGWQTLLHEIGHTLGLKHPGPYNAGGGKAAGPYLSTADDNHRTTIMSYKSTPDSTNWKSLGNGSYTTTGLNPATYMPLDILALQFLYGKNTSAASTTDDSRRLSDYQTTTFNSDWLGMQTLASGVEGLSINASGIGASNIFDLRPGAFSSVNIKDASYNSGIGAGRNPQTFFNLNNVGLAYSSSVSSVLGGKGTDIVYVGRSNVVIDGGDGNGKVVLFGKAADWTSAETNDGMTYTNGSISATLKNIEKIAYYDETNLSIFHSRVDLSA